MQLSQPAMSDERGCFVGILEAALIAEANRMADNALGIVSAFKQTASLPTTRQGSGGLASGKEDRGRPSDDQGNVYVSRREMAASTPGRAPAVPNPGRIGDFNGSSELCRRVSRIRYQRTGAGRGALNVNDWFLPFLDSKRAPPQGDMDYQDQDLGSGAAVATRHQTGPGGRQGRDSLRARSGEPGQEGR